ncbi:MAG: molybdopterin-dependent oxidoreductase, partial [Leucothrix sp.]
MKHTDLPLTSTHWGAYRVETENGRVKALHSFEEDQDSSAIGSGIIDVLDSPSRIKTPMVRASWLQSGPGSHNQQRGVDPFVSVSWETAERLVADELNRVRHTFGNNAIYAGSYGWASAGRFHHAQSQVHRFLNCIGGYTRSVNTYSLASAEVVLPHIMAPLFPMLVESTSWPSVIEHTDLLVAFGGIPLKNGQINSGGVGNHVQKNHLKQVQAAGIELINISPVRNDIA